MKRKSEVIPLVSFPKSGNTWMRFLLANLFKRDRKDEINFSNINLYTPASSQQDYTETSKLLIPGAPIFLKEHYNYYNMPYENYERAIYIYRDGFDSLNSYWHFTDAQSPGKYRSVEQFVHCYWKYCGHWGDHLYSWMKEHKDKEVLALRYESILKDPEEEVVKCLNFLGIEISQERVEEAIYLSGRKQMKKMEGSEDFMNAKKRGFHFVRSGRSGEGKKTLSDYCMDKFISYEMNFRMMEFYGYIKMESKWDKIDKVSKDSIYNKLRCSYLDYKYRLKNIF